MTFGQAVRSGFKNYINFTGRASRSEFWFWYLFSSIVLGLVPTILFLMNPNEGSSGFYANMNFIELWSGIMGLFLLLPNLAMQIRRLHDSNRSGGFWFLILIPFIGPLILLILFLQPSVNDTNRFGK